MGGSKLFDCSKPLKVWGVDEETENWILIHTTMHCYWIESNGDECVTILIVVRRVLWVQTGAVDWISSLA